MRNGLLNTPWKDMSTRDRKRVVWVVGGILLLILIILLVALFRDQISSAVRDFRDGAADRGSDTSAAANTGDGGELRLSPDGIYINWQDGPSSEYRLSNGTYMVPVSYLEELVPEAVAFVFEGEFWNTIGEHHVCILIPDQDNYANACPTTENDDGDEVFHLNQNSFWGYTAASNGWLPDDLLQVFAWNKWQNGQTQSPVIEWPIYVHLTDGTESYATGEEPRLTDTQKLYVSQAEAERCPADAPAILEEPYSDSSGGHSVTGAPGSYSCRTLFVGQLTSHGDMVALYWQGARDGFSYWSEDAAFYLIPVSWGESEMQAFVTDLVGAGVSLSYSN